MKVLKNVTHLGALTDICIDGGKIISIGKTDSEGIDMGGLKVYPGLIDVHCHGCIGYDVMDKEDRLSEMSEFLASNGTTCWYPTTMTMSGEDIVNATSREIGGRGGATIAGFHLEGPFINPKYKGAQNPNFIFKPSMALFEKCKNVKMISLAPELPGSRDFIEKCPAIVSLGHSDADYETAKGAMRAGIKCLTHTFNAMPGIHHRMPGPILAAVESDGVYAQLIADGIHVHPAVLRMIIKLMGSDRIVLISDSIRATGLPDGEYDLGGLNITVKERVAKTEDGHIAGSSSMLIDCVRFLISAGIEESVAVKMASENPARLMGLNKGKIEAGYDADFIFVSEGLNIEKVMINGEFCK